MNGFLYALANQVLPHRHPEDIERNCLALHYGGKIEARLRDLSRVDVLLPDWIVEVEKAETARVGLQQLLLYERVLPDRGTWLHICTPHVKLARQQRIREQVSEVSPETKLTFWEEMSWNQTNDDAESLLLASAYLHESSRSRLENLEWFNKGL